MRRIAMRAAAVAAASLVLAGCAGTQDAAPTADGPNGYTLAADLGDGYHLWWDRSQGSGLTDLIAIGPQQQIIGSCLGHAGQLCFVGPSDGRISLVIADPAAETGVIHFYGQDVQLVTGEGPGDDDPSVFAVRLPEERPNPDAGWSVELFDASEQPVPLE